MTDLFKLGTYVLNSGIKSDFKIDCDALTATEMRALVNVALKLLPPFRKAYGIPTGGLAFAKELEFYARTDAETVVIADDVLTTGRSFEHFKRDLLRERPTISGVHIVGVTMFARGPCPDWIIPIFTLNSRVPQERTLNDPANDRTVRPADRKIAA